MIATAWRPARSMRRRLPAALLATATLLAGAMSLWQAGQAHAEPQPFLTVAELRDRYAHPDDRYIEISGVRLRFRDQGEGPAIVLLHGSNSSLEKYDALATQLRSRYRLIRFDMPGMGLSEHLDPANPSAIPGDELVAALLDHLAISRAVIVGNSAGGSIACFFAARFPQRTQALVLANTPSDSLSQVRIERSPELAQQFALAAELGYRTYEYWETYLRWLAGDPARIDTPIIQRYFDMNRRHPELAAQPSWRLTTAEQETLDALHAVSVPTLLLWGTRSPVMPLGAAERIEHHLKSTHSSRLLLEDVGHYPPLEAPERFAMLLAAYIEAVLTPAANAD